MTVSSWDWDGLIKPCRRGRVCLLWEASTIQGTLGSGVEAIGPGMGAARHLPGARSNPVGFYRAGLGAAARWKASMVERASGLFARSAANLQSYIYGTSALADAQQVLLEHILFPLSRSHGTCNRPWHVW